MNKLWFAPLAGVALGAYAIGALAQDAGSATVQIAESEEYGQYLTDGEGRALYLFTTDTQGTEGTDPVVSCSGGCLENWPPLFSTGEPQAGEGADEAMLGTVNFMDQMMVTYNGWPLYYFAGDAEPGQTNGQERGDVWYLVNPAGEAIHSE